MTAAPSPLEATAAKPPPAPTGVVPAAGGQQPSQVHRVLLGGTLAEFLGPLLMQPTTVPVFVFPWLLRRVEEDRERGTERLPETLALLETILDTFELQEVARGVFARAAVAARRSCIGLSAAGSEPHVRLAAGLLARDRFAKLLFTWDQFMPTLERLLLVAKPPPHALRTMLPTVCSPSVVAGRRACRRLCYAPASSAMECPRQSAVRCALSASGS